MPLSVHRLFLGFARSLLACAAVVAVTAMAASTPITSESQAVAVRQDGPGPASGAALTVGMHYVIPPFVGGAKVRTPEAPDTVLAEALAKGLGYGGVRAVKTDADAADKLLQGAMQVALVSLPDGKGEGAFGPGIVIVSTGYTSRPMAILRSDTDIKSWEQLRGRTVCLSAGGQYVGTLAERYGAVEMVKRAPADALLAVRTGLCDAAVHDETMLRTLLKLPEWKKFSATLPPGPATHLVFAIPQADGATLQAAKAVVADWHSRRVWSTLNKQRVNDIAFEVYLDQTVPDCH